MYVLSAVVAAVRYDDRKVTVALYRQSFARPPGRKGLSGGTATGHITRDLKFHVGGKDST